MKRRILRGVFSVCLSACIFAGSMSNAAAETQRNTWGYEEDEDYAPWENDYTARDNDSGWNDADGGEEQSTDQDDDDWDDDDRDDDDRDDDDWDDDDWDDDDQESQVEVSREISLGTQQETEEIWLTYGENVRFVLDTESETSVYTMFKERIASVEYQLLDEEDESITGSSSTGVFLAQGFGKNRLQVTVLDVEGNRIEGLEDRIFSLVSGFDMKKVKAEKKKFEVYVKGENNEWENYSPENSFEIKMNGLPESITEETYGLEYTTDVRESVLGLNTELYDGVLHVYITGVGTIHLTVGINGKNFKFTFKIKEVMLKGSTSFYMTPKQKKTLKVKNGTGAVWKSTNSSVISVTKKGKIKAKKTGNAVITAKVKGIYVGCVISVVTKARLKVVKRARYMGTHWKYSQDKRMQKGYYDCSALVWKAYRLEKKTFGSGGYAPVAADIAKYCANHKKEVRGDAWKKIQKMKFNPGALTFKVGPKNNRYKNIYHVEMFVGYTLEWISDKGKAQLGTKWAAREDNYDYGEVWAQP